MSGIISLALFALATVASAAGPAPVLLGTSGNYAILAKAGVSTVPQSSITGDLGISPVAQTYYTGFSLTASDTGTYATSTQVAGRLYAANDQAPTPSVLTSAIGDMQTAFTDAAGRTNGTLNLGAGTVGGLVFTPGVYTWGSDLNFIASCSCVGNVNDIQVSGDMIVASGVQLVLAGGAVPGNIVFVVSGATTFSSTSQWNGIVLGQTAIHLDTGASINGRLLAQTAVTLQSATVQSTGLGGLGQNSSTSSTQKRATRYSVKLL
ncbi:hypothetical protein RQP46_010135 [Phenoliferia psychrophenolica]